MAKDVFQQARGIALALGARTGCQIFQFARSLAFVGDHAEAFQIRIKECEQIAPLQIAVNHVFLLVTQQKQLQKALLISRNFFNAQRVTSMCY